MKGAGKKALAEPTGPRKETELVGVGQFPHHISLVHVVVTATAQFFKVLYAQWQQLSLIVHLNRWILLFHTQSLQDLCKDNNYFINIIVMKSLFSSFLRFFLPSAAEVSSTTSNQHNHRTVVFWRGDEKVENSKIAHKPTKLDDVVELIKMEKSDKGSQRFYARQYDYLDSTFGFAFVRPERPISQ
jgi:hypothetical protein